MATFVLLDSNSIIKNVTHGDDDWPNSEYTKITGTLRNPGIGDYYDSISNTLTHAININDGETNLDENATLEESLPVSLSFSYPLDSSLDSSSILLESASISEFRINNNSLTFLISPLNEDLENQDAVYDLVIKIDGKTLTNQPNLYFDACGWEHKTIPASGSI
jgi:hexokinase